MLADDAIAEVLEPEEWVLVPRVCCADEVEKVRNSTELVRMFEVTGIEDAESVGTDACDFGAGCESEGRKTSHVTPGARSWTMAQWLRLQIPNLVRAAFAQTKAPGVEQGM